MADDAFDEAFADDVDAAPEPVKEEPAKAEPEPAAETDTKEKEPEAAPEPKDEKEPEPSPAEPDKSPVPGVTLDQWKGYLDEREKRQSLETETRQLRERLQQIERQQQQKPEEKAPDIYDNPEGYAAHLQTQQQQAIMQMKVQQSDFLARRDYGDELLDKVRAWAEALPNERANVLLNHASPMHAAVEAYKQEQASATLREHDYDLDKLKAKWLEEMKATPAPQQTAAQPETKPDLPPKVAGQGNVVETPKMDEGSFFTSVFER